MKPQKIILVTGIAYPEVGGPAVYVKKLEEALHDVHIHTRVISYTAFEQKLPSWIKHVVFCARIIGSSFGADQIWAFDTYVSGFPAYVAARVLGKPFLIRIGGDFLWEHYVNRTKEPILLSDFYTTKRAFTRKEKIIFSLTKKVIIGATYRVFSTLWQKQIWQVPYHIPYTHTTVIENAYAVSFAPQHEQGKKGMFVSPARDSAVKNKEIIRGVITELRTAFPFVSLDETNLPYDAHIARVAKSYAVIIPSLSEVSPNLLLDSMACGKPFIATEDCGYREQFAECGIFCDTRNKETLLKAVRSLVEDEALYARYKEAITHISWQRNYDNVRDDFLRFIQMN